MINSWKRYDSKKTLFSLEKKVTSVRISGFSKNLVNRLIVRVQNSDSTFPMSSVHPSTTWRKSKSQQYTRNKSTESHAGSVGFLHVLFFHLFFYFVFFIAKILDLYQNRKINPVRRILGKSIQDCFCVFFCFCSGFLLSQAQLSKNSRKTKKNKKKQKNQSCEKNLG